MGSAGALLSHFTASGEAAFHKQNLKIAASTQLIAQSP